MTRGGDTPNIACDQVGQTGGRAPTIEELLAIIAVQQGQIAAQQEQISALQSRVVRTPMKRTPQADSNGQLRPIDLATRGRCFGHPGEAPKDRAPLLLSDVYPLMYLSVNC